MKHFWSFFYCVLFACTTQAGLSEDLDRILLRNKVAKSDLSLIVQNVGSDSQVVYKSRETELMIPASLTKIVTAVSALEIFGPTHTVPTKLLSQDAPKDGIIHGPLFIKGGGDPSFVSETMWVLVNHLSRHRVREIQGGIIIDASEFDESHFDSSREDVRVDRAYDAPVSAMSFNWNSVNVYVRAGAKAGDPVQVTADPVNDYIAVMNRAKTGSARSDNSIAVSRVADGKKDSVVVSGSLPVGSAEIVIYKSISNPILWAGFNLQQFLKEKGITVKGEIRAGTAPKSAFELASVDSVQLGRMVTDMMKFSNNYVAEMLTKLISVSAGVRPGSINGGLARMREILNKVPLSGESYKLVNPSGLTRENRFSSLHLNQVLQSTYKNFRIGPEFVNSLPVAGRDGTLKSRIRGRGAGWVRAKTGLLSGVVGIAGFAGRTDGDVVSFAFIYNGASNSQDAKVRDAFDDMAERLTNPK